MTLQLPIDLENFITERVRAGEYASAQDVVCAALQLLKMRTTTHVDGDFEPGEWDRLLEEAEVSNAMILDQAVARWRAERESPKSGR